MSSAYEYYKDRRKTETTSLVNPWIKWLMFSFNMLFWLISLLLIGVGIYAYILTQEFNNRNGTGGQGTDIFDILFDFTLIFITFGVVVFILSFLGAIGALRENICMLRTFSVCLTILFLLEIGVGVTVFVLSAKVKAGLQDILKDEAVMEYRETDINRNNIIDWFQETFECCGVGEAGYKSWENNKYFSCKAPGFEACSVPYSCCKKEFRFKYDSEVIYPRCGHGMLDPQISRSEANRVIFVRGCIDAAIASLHDQMFIVAGVAVGFGIIQLLGISFSWVLAKQINAQRRR